MHDTEQVFTFQVPFWQANYQDPLIPSYRNNPLIETLPPIYNRDQVCDLLQHDPGYEEQYRQWPIHQRLHLILDATHFFQPLNIHFELEERISRLIRSGYIGRNPLDLGFWPETKQNLRAIQNSSFPRTPHVSAQGFTIVGISGMGKTRAIESILSLYPQVVQHHQYNGKRFTWTQLVWLKLDCPQDGSLAGLCQDFFQQVDMLLGTNYYENYGLRGKPTIDRMRVSMATVVSNHSIGALVIDEIQNLRDARSEGAARMLNFFVQLDNTIGVPIILVGTPKALPVLTGEFRRARRATGQGDVPWERMGKNDEWQFFLETLWKYQYMCKSSPLTSALSDIIYEESQGITDIAIKLYLLAQIRAITRQEDDITIESIRRVTTESLGSVQKFLDALRTNNLYELRRYEDIKPINLERELQKAQMQVQPTQPKPNDKINGTTKNGRLKEADKSDHQGQSLQLASEESPKVVDRGLRALITQGDKTSINIYEALKKSNFICDSKEYFLEEIAK